MLVCAAYGESYTSCITRQGFKPLAHNISPLKWTKYLLGKDFSPLKWT
jgi:hypothetical protein